MISSNFILVTKWSEETPRSGFVPTTTTYTATFPGGYSAPALLAGMPVQVDNAGSPAPAIHNDLTAWRLANGGLGGLNFLLRTAINPTPFEHPLKDVMFGDNDVNPVLAGLQAAGGEPVDARPALEIEAEGGNTDADGLAVYLKTASTGAISSGTAADTLLTIVAGQWAVLTDVASQAICGRLVKQIVPYTAGNVRICIDVCEPRFDKVV